jgi:hypothetical protein
VRVLKPALIGEQRVVHLPERTLLGGRLGGTGGWMRTWMAGAHREVPEADTQVERVQACLERRAEGALIVAIDDAEETVAPDVIVGADRRYGG